MVEREKKRLSREDWLHGALDLLCSGGLESVKIVPLSKKLGVTSGSFYWHFSNRSELFESLLNFWDHEITDKAIEGGKKFQGTPEKRIWNLMEKVMNSGMASFDLAIWHWAQSDTHAQLVFKRVLDKRFAIATWMFTQVGFDKIQAEIRGRMMVVYMMGESTLVAEDPENRKEQLRLNHDILTNL